ncbi:unnamed protein product [Clonostachys rosea]|uniref:AB hydrolase-1 domain-containing protein n=1 Tax=Bionectria ochroleuca TaxID=29856 RepID=A0ABY6UJN1_BIOOC|nr:unnamed protein product [Clonostachys rosea]
MGDSSQPTLVLVPGSWHRAACYNKITEILQGRYKLKCIQVTLPSTTGDPEATFKMDVDAARDAISSETRAGCNVVVVAHSYGGLVGNSAIKGFAPSHDPSVNSSFQSRPDVGQVIGLILIASGYALTGVAFMDPFFGHPPPQWRVNKGTGFAEIVIPPRQFFYHDLPEDEAEYWVSQLTPQSLKSLFEGGEFAYSGFRDVPSWYIGTIEDQGLPVAAQRMTVAMARGMGASVEHRELPTSHSPFLSRPEETVEIMVEAVEAFTGRPVAEDGSRTRARGKDLVVPEVRLWQPITWYRFGLPFFVGRFLGKCVLMFQWSKWLWRSKQCDGFS